jgi:hypothetical protein
MQAEKYFLIESVYFDPVQFFHAEVHTTTISTSIEIPDVYVPIVPPEEPPENPDPDDPPHPPGDPRTGNPTQLSNHAEFLYWIIQQNAAKLGVDPWWFGITTLVVPPIRAGASGVTFDDIVIAFASHGLYICKWQGLQYVLMKNWLGGGLVNWFFRENPPGSGEWWAEWLFIYGQVIYNGEDIMYKIRRL